MHSSPVRMQTFCQHTRPDLHSPAVRPPRGFLGRLANFAQGSHAGEMVGAISGTCWSGLSKESLYSHNPNGSTVCIHSVVVVEKYRGRGYATVLLKVQTTISGCDGCRCRAFVTVGVLYTYMRHILLVFLCFLLFEENGWTYTRYSCHDGLTYT